jgi:hypothetical protein
VVAPACALSARAARPAIICASSRALNGRLVVAADEGETVEIGRVIDWAPGERLAFTWRPNSVRARPGDHGGSALRVRRRRDAGDGGASRVGRHPGVACGATRLPTRRVPAASGGVLAGAARRPLRRHDWEAHQSFLYGRVTTDDGATYEGRLRWGGDEEAFWGDYFNGARTRTPGPPTCRPSGCPRSAARSRSSGSRSPSGEHPIDLGRPFMARFGDIARIEARGRDVRVTLKSGTVFDLDRFGRQRLRRRRAGVGRRAASWTSTAADPHDRAPPTPPARRRPRPAARYGAHAAGRLHRLRPVGPGGVRRHRRARRPHRRR